MNIHFYNPNLGVDPRDPDYDDSFNEEEELDRYYAALEEREERERGN